MNTSEANAAIVTHPQPSQPVVSAEGRACHGFRDTTHMNETHCSREQGETRAAAHGQDHEEVRDVDLAGEGELLNVPGQAHEAVRGTALDTNDRRPQVAWQASQSRWLVKRAPGKHRRARDACAKGAGAVGQLWVRDVGHVGDFNANGQAAGVLERHVRAFLGRHGGAPDGTLSVRQTRAARRSGKTCRQPRERPPADLGQ